MIENEEMIKDTAWTPYREITRYRRLLMVSTFVNLVLSAALLYVMRMMR